jgi:hypothetical protein
VKAKKFLSDAGIDPKSLSVKVTFVNAGDGPTIAQFFQAQLRQNLGVDIQLDPQESKVYKQLVSDKKGLPVDDWRLGRGLSGPAGLAAGPLWDERR